MHTHQALGGARDSTVSCVRRSMAASGRALAAAAAARASTHVRRAACCTVTNGHHVRALNAAQRAVMVKRARSRRSMLPVSCSAVTRRDSAIRCVREARARQAHLLETRASSRTVRQVVRRPALALTWQPAFVAPPRRAGAVLGASTRRAGARGTVLSGGRKKPASCVAALGVTVSFGPGAEWAWRRNGPGAENPRIIRPKRRRRKYGAHMGAGRDVAHRDVSCSRVADGHALKHY